MCYESKKLVWNSESLDWAYWANLQSISAKDACWLVCGIDPNICNNDSIESKYYLPDEKRIEIKNAITQIESDIRARKEKEYNSPWDWVCWAEGKGIPIPTKFHALAFEAKKKSIHVHKAQPLEKISEESLAWYLKQDSWAYYEAIFLIQGYKPPGFIEGFDEVRTHFADVYVMLQRSIDIGAIGREVNQAGQKNFIDTPERWMEWGKSKGVLCEFLTRFEANNENQNSLKLEELVVANINTPESKQSEPEIHALFDPMNKNAIKLLFDKVTESDWTEYFNRAARNGLKDIREKDGQYNPARIAEWLVNKGRYTKEYVDRKLANNLPERSKDKKYLITGDFD